MSCCRFPFLMVALSALIAAAPAPAQFLLISNYGNNTVGKYDAVTGAAINATFINNQQGLNGPVGLAVDGNNLYVANELIDTVSQYNATTGSRAPSPPK